MYMKCTRLKSSSETEHLFLFFCFIFRRLQDSLEFIGQDSNTLRPDQNTGANSLLGNIGN